MRNRVAEPYQLERMTFTVDGAAVALSTLPPVDSEGAVLARLRLPPGPHALQVFASASYPAASPEHGPSMMTLSTMQAFRVDEAPAALEMEIHAQPAEKGAWVSGAGAAPRLEVSFALKGGELAPAAGSRATEKSGPGAAAPSSLDGATHRAGVAHCERRAPVGRALCRTESLLERASADNDVVVVACLRDKLGKLRVMVDILGSRSSSRSPSAATPGVHGGSPIAERELLSIADQRAEEIASEAERCIGLEGVEAPARAMP